MTITIKLSIAKGAVKQLAIASIIIIAAAAVAVMLNLKPEDLVITMIIQC
jgi:hypothetical protein